MRKDEKELKKPESHSEDVRAEKIDKKQNKPRSKKKEVEKQGRWVGPALLFITIIISVMISLLSK